MPESQLQSGAKPDGIIQDILFGSSKLAAETQDQNDQETVKLVMQMFQKAKNWKATWSRNHDRWWNLWESNHYKGREAHTLTRAIINQVWSSVETFLGHVVDGLPDPITRARAPENQEKAKITSKWLRYEADAQNLEQEIQHPVRSACVTGAGWMAIEWDETLCRNRGDVRYVPVDEKFIFTAPNCRNLQECLYLIDARNVPREWITKNYERGQYVPPGVQDGSLNNARAYADENRSDQAAPNYALLTTTTGSDSRWTGSQGVMGAKSSDLVTLIKCYIRQDDGTMRLVVVANGVVLQDGPSPYEDDDFPYVVFNILPTLDTIQGRGIVQFIEGLQEILNASVSYLLDQQRFVADPMLIVDSINLEDGQLADNSPGAILPNSSPNGPGYTWMQAPGFNQGWLQIQEIVTGYMDSVLGRVDVLKGERPAGVNTLGGLEIIRDEANVRMRSLIRWVKASLKRVYLLTISRLRQFAKGERTIRILGKGGQEEFLKVNPIMAVDPSGNAIQDETLPEDAEFDVEFSKDVPGGRQAKIELALTLAGTPAEDGMPMVDRQYVLDQCEVEEAPEILSRMEELASAQAKAEEDQAMREQGVQPPPEQDPMQVISSLFSGGQAA